MRHSLSDQSTRASVIVSSWAKHPKLIPEAHLVKVFNEKAIRAGNASASEIGSVCGESESEDISEIGDDDGTDGDGEGKGDGSDETDTDIEEIDVPTLDREFDTSVGS